MYEWHTAQPFFMIIFTKNKKKSVNPPEKIPPVLPLPNVHFPPTRFIPQLNNSFHVITKYKSHF